MEMNKHVSPLLSIIFSSVTMVAVVAAALFYPLWLIAVPVLVLGVIFQAMFLYKLWEAVPVENRSTTPGRAVGFLFIPFFNFYWVFRAYVCLVDDTQRTTGKPGPRGLAIAYAVLFSCNYVCRFIPFLGAVTGIATFVVWLLMVLKLAQHANHAIQLTANPPKPVAAPAMPAQVWA